jgi:hypothetical protein
MYCDLWPYVWLVSNSGFYSRAGYSGARTVVRLPILLTQNDSLFDGSLECPKGEKWFVLILKKIRHRKVASINSCS